MSKNSLNTICGILSLACLLAGDGLPGSNYCHAAPSKQVMNVVLKLTTIAAGAKLAEQATESLQEYFADTAGPGESVYSAEFDFKRSSWADWFSKPDVFVVVECEGNKRFVIPDIEYNWDLGKKIVTFRCPTLQPGSHCLLRLYDDDSASDQVWKHILALKATWNVSATARPGPNVPIKGLVALEAKATASGQLSLLTPGQAQALVLDAPEPMATAEFEVPTDPELNRWEMSGSLMQDSTNYGTIRLTHWYTHPMPTIANYLLQPKLIFWAVILVGIVAVLGKRWFR